MNKYELSLNALDNLFLSTSIEEINSIYTQINKYGFSGPTIKEYFDECEMNFNVEVPDNLPQLSEERLIKPQNYNYKFPENNTPNFSGCYFCNIA